MSEARFGKHNIDLQTFVKTWLHILDAQLLKIFLHFKGTKAVPQFSLPYKQICCVILLKHLRTT